jgi:branched-chain amino acid transport system ATP-binding protein
VTDRVLSVRDLRLRFGGIAALDGVSFDVARGATVGIIGPNGAGKTTLFNCLSGLYRADSGDIVLDGRSLLGTPSHAIAALGIGRTFQNLALFRSMTVRDTAMLGGHCRGRTGFLQNALNLPVVRREERALAERVDALLALLELDRVADANVMRLPVLQQKRVEIARALAGEPRLLMLDEPASGLNHDEVEALTALLDTLRRRLDVTLLVVEHRLPLVMGISDQVVVLDFGRKIADGTPAEVRAHPDVVRAYLGTAS